MTNYKNWKLLNESFVGTFTSTVSRPNIVGGVVGAMGAELEEGKKCCKKKKMDAGTIGKPEEVEDDETGDGEVVDAASPKDEEPVEKGEKKLPPWLNKKEGKDECGFDPEGDQSGKVLPWLNRKGNKGEQDKKNAHEKLQKLSDKVKKEAAEAVDDFFFASLKSQIGNSVARHNDGLSDLGMTEIGEDALVQSVRPEPVEPGPGEIGYAPTGRIFQLAGMADDEGNSLLPTMESVKKN